MKSAASPVQQALDLLEAVAAVQLEKTLDVHTEDEISTMARALNTAIHAMRRTMGEVAASRERERQQAAKLQAKVDALLVVVRAAAPRNLIPPLKERRSFYVP